MICLSCELANEHIGDGDGNMVEHCVGKGEGCTCECALHTFPPGDPRFVFISVLTAEAHNDFNLLKAVIAGLTEDEAKSSLLLAAKYAIWMARTAGVDPVQMVRSAALFWSGGEDDESMPT